jgi:NodT family efflux transporter outer membrane factor (OMF) lipoprotein
MPDFRTRGARRTLYRMVIAGGLVALAGCQTMTEIPGEVPAVPEKTAWRAVPEVSAAAVIEPDWWRGFGDDDLDRLMQQALEDNTDLAIALARIGEAGAAVGSVEAQRLPSLNAGISTPINRSRNPMTGDYETSRQYSGRAGLNWEIDIWGKLQKAVEAKQSGYQASEAEWRATYLNIASQVATAYFLIRQLDAQAAIQQTSLDGARQALGIYEAQFDEGLVSSKEVLRQQAEINSLQRSLIDLQRERQVTENALATLLGIPAGNLAIDVADAGHAIADMPVPGGLPAELLRRRPDILAAEYRVLEAYQLVGEARLAQLPSVSLTANAQGGGSLASAALNSFLRSMTFGLTPSINIPLFDPETKARIKRSEARTDTVEAQYRRTVLVAFQEVEDALVNLSARRAQRDELVTEAATLQLVADQVERQLAEGMVTQLELFEAQRRLLEVNKALVNNRQQILSETVTLYKAMGGGWPAETVL